MKTFKCSCKGTLSFEDRRCAHCSAEVGFDFGSSEMRVIEADGDWQRCANGIAHGICNGVTKKGPGTFCLACDLNRMVPNLANKRNLWLWERMEAAKRRVVYTLGQLDLPVSSRHSDPLGVYFDFLIPDAGNVVTTGHLDGVITLNTLEADDWYREGQRRQLGEPYRTLVGHFRHEFGHYYWDRLFRGRAADDPWLIEWRTLFGDEREDYAAALGRYYRQGPMTGWEAYFISAYASSHPWEDWAETWAQYLHMIDALETARTFGWEQKAENAEPAVEFPEFRGDPAFGEMFAGWASLVPMVNEISVGLGHTTLYPFSFSAVSQRKLHFVHRVLLDAQNRQLLAA